MRGVRLTVLIFILALLSGCVGYYHPYGYSAPVDYRYGAQYPGYYGYRSYPTPRSFRDHDEYREHDGGYGGYGRYRRHHDDD